MAMVAAFAVSAHATQTFRVSKPFDPLLGETYECDRSEDLGWRCFALETHAKSAIRLPNKLGWGSGVAERPQCKIR